MAKVKGLDKLIKDLAKLGEEGIKTIAGVTETTARQIESDAKQLAPIDTGKLRQSIKSFEVGKLKWKILANATGLAPYAAYMEFGTGGLVEVPAELEEIAAQFKGAGVKRIDLRPRPYLYPAFIEGRVNYVKDLQQDLEDLTNGI